MSKGMTRYRKTERGGGLFSAIEHEPRSTTT